ncbi:hypothetical protein C0995_010623 [Termitomyces sp. Mi166|nr:hypothetical protein C0995_010623 [Termitomyces sp. Mi166\
MSFSAPPQSARIRQPLSPLRQEVITEGHEPMDEHARKAKLTASTSVELDSGSLPTPRPSLHRTSKPLHSILKRKTQTTEEREDAFHSGQEPENRFEISVVRYRTSCCKSIVSMEDISDVRVPLYPSFSSLPPLFYLISRLTEHRQWIHETPSNVHRCPSCMLPCVLKALCTPTSSQSQSLLPASVSLGLKFERVLPLARSILRQQYAKIKLALPSPSPKHRPDPMYGIFDTDDETYPETEFTRVLSSSLFTTDVKETSMRLLSITGLTLVLLALLSQ